MRKQKYLKEYDFFFLQTYTLYIQKTVGNSITAITGNFKRRLV